MGQHWNYSVIVMDRNVARSLFRVGVVPAVLARTVQPISVLRVYFLSFIFAPRPPLSDLLRIWFFRHMIINVPHYIPTVLLRRCALNWRKVHVADNSKKHFSLHSRHFSSSKNIKRSCYNFWISNINLFATDKRYEISGKEVKTMRNVNLHDKQKTIKEF